MYRVTPIVTTNTNDPPPIIFAPLRTPPYPPKMDGFILTFRHRETFCQRFSFLAVTV